MLETKDENRVVRYNITDMAISEMAEEYKDLVIGDLEDGEQFALVHDARMVVKGKRIEVEKKRKELKVEALAWGRKVDSEANRIFLLLKPIESRLQAEEDKVLDERKRIKEQAEKKLRLMIMHRLDSLLRLNVDISYAEVAEMDELEFSERLISASARFKEDQERDAKEKADREAERERLDKQQIELDAREKAIKEKEVQFEKEPGGVKKEVSPVVKADPGTGNPLVLAREVLYVFADAIASVHETFPVPLFEPGDMYGDAIKIVEGAVLILRELSDHIKKEADLLIVR
jgi:hypothetical protein